MTSSTEYMYGAIDHSVPMDYSPVETLL